jgi:formate dehydrogenase subunit delta
MSHDTQSHSHTLERLIYMANQIGGFFAAQGHDKAVAGTANHIQKFWDPRMKNQIFAYLDKGGEGLTPHVKEALQTLEKKQQAAQQQQ